MGKEWISPICHVLSRPVLTICRQITNGYQQSIIFLLKIFNQCLCFTWNKKAPYLYEAFLVDLSGFEPLTSAMRMQRSTNWATGPNRVSHGANLEETAFGHKKMPGDLGRSWTCNLVLRTDLLYPVELRGRRFVMQKCPMCRKIYRRLCYTFRRFAQRV